MRFCRLFRLRRGLPTLGALLLSLLLTGCGGASMLASSNQALDLVINGMEDAPFDRAYVDSFPYAMIAAKIGLGPRSLLVLGEVKGDDYYWYSADRVLLITRHGRVVATGGLPVDLVATRFRDGDPLVGLTKDALVDMQPSVRIVDYRHKNFIGMPVTSTLSYLGRQRLDMMGPQYDTEMFEEEVESDFLDWQATNRFWIDASGQVRKSLQHYAPGEKPIQIEVLK